MRLSIKSGETDAGQCLSRCATQGRSVTVTNSRQPNRDPASFGQASSSATAGRGPAASVEMWRRRSAPTCGDRLAKLLADLARARRVESIREADATENHSLRRKSLLRRAIHRPRPREPHPASHGQYVTVTQCSAPASCRSMTRRQERRSTVMSRSQQESCWSTNRRSRRPRWHRPAPAVLTTHVP